MGIYRIEVMGREKQADVEKGFQATKEKAGSYNDGKNAIASCKAMAELYDSESTLIVWETKNGKEYNHFEIKGKADHDMHDPKPTKKPAQAKPAKLKVVKTTKEKKAKKIAEG